MIHVAQVIINHTKMNVFLFIVSDISQKPQSLIKRIGLLRGIVPPPLIVNVKGGKRINGIIQDGTDKTVAAINYKPVEAKEVQMERHGETLSLN